MAAEPESPKTIGSNVVLIGQKPVMSYVMACVTFFNQGNSSLTIKARGGAISKAVDTVELLRRAFMKDVVVKNIELGTQQLDRQGRRSNVSTMEIHLEKPLTPA